MSDFEVVVRPVVFPNIRPAPARSLPPEDDPTKGFAVIRGNPGQSFDLSYSYSFNATSSNSTETEREVDVARIYQEDDDGNVNKSNFVDVEVPKKIWQRGAAGDWWQPGVEGTQPKLEIMYRVNYKPVEEKSNIEIKERDKRIQNPAA